MEIGSIGRNYSAGLIAKDATPTEATVPQDAETAAADEKYDRLVHGLTKLNEAAEKADEDAKARAKQKLKDAQEQLKFLLRWGMDPEVIARQAAQLGAVVAAAAREFTDALTGGAAIGSISLSNGAAEINGADLLQPDAQGEVTGEAGEKQGSPSQAEQAYRDVMQDSEPTRPSSLSADDIRTATEFSTIAKQIKAILEKAARDLREKSNAMVSPNTQSLDAAVTAMTGAVAAAPTVAITI